MTFKPISSNQRATIIEGFKTNNDAGGNIIEIVNDLAQKYSVSASVVLELLIVHLSYATVKNIKCTIKEIALKSFNVDDIQFKIIKFVANKRATELLVNFEVTTIIKQDDIKSFGFEICDIMTKYKYSPPLSMMSAYTEYKKDKTNGDSESK